MPHFDPETIRELFNRDQTHHLERKHPIVDEPGGDIINPFGV